MKNLTFLILCLLYSSLNFAQVSSQPQHFVGSPQDYTLIKINNDLLQADLSAVKIPKGSTISNIVIGVRNESGQGQFFTANNSVYNSKTKCLNLNIQSLGGGQLKVVVFLDELNAQGRLKPISLIDKTITVPKNSLLDKVEPEVTSIRPREIYFSSESVKMLISAKDPQSGLKELQVQVQNHSDGHSNYLFKDFSGTNPHSYSGTIQSYGGFSQGVYHIVKVLASDKVGNIKLYGEQKVRSSSTENKVLSKEIQKWQKEKMFVVIDDRILDPKTIDPRKEIDHRLRQENIYDGSLNFKNYLNDQEYKALSSPKNKAKHE